MVDDLSEIPDIDFRCRHSAAGGKHYALMEVVKCLREEAGKAFAENRDERAQEARRLAGVIEVMRQKAERELDLFIAEADRRRESP